MKADLGPQVHVFFRHHIDSSSRKVAGCTIHTLSTDYKEVSFMHVAQLLDTYTVTHCMHVAIAFAKNLQRDLQRSQSNMKHFLHMF
jgi:hypothetical protein